MVALYAVPLHSGRRQAWTAAVLTVTAMALAAAFFQPGPLLGPQRVGAVAWMGLATVVGDSVRNRRAYVRALEERAEPAERTREEEAARCVAGERMRIARELHDVVAHERSALTAAALGAFVVFEDEAGFSMAPPTARTWGRRGHTPVVRVRGRSWRRWSIAAMCCYRPGESSRLIYRPRRHRKYRGKGRDTFAWRDYRDLPTFSWAP